MSEYPEHIDQIDDFYRNQLADHEIAPPDGLWDKISASAFEIQSPETPAVSSASGLLTKTQKLLSLGAATAIIVAGTFYLYSVKKDDHSSTKDKNAPVEQQEEYNPDTTIPNSPEETGDPSVSPSDQSNKKVNASGHVNQKEGDVIVPEVQESQTVPTQTEEPLINAAAKEEHKADSIAEIKTAPVLPKEKVKFKDKYKKDYQDSTHKIFVPGK